MAADSTSRAEVRALQTELALSLAQVRELGDRNRELLLAAGASQSREASIRTAHQRQATLLLMVAHELRNPLTPLRLAARMLDGARAEPAVHERLRATIERQVIQMTRLIDDLVDGARVGFGSFRIERTVVELVPLLDVAVQTSRTRMDGRRQVLRCAMPAGSAKVLGDPVRLAQVFGNLLDNASKYTPEGGEISLEVESGPDVVVMRVRDNGIGISEEALPNIFGMFVRDAHAAEADSGGLGIGLAVVEQIVKSHEGTVVARSAGIGRGSEFIVTLPAQPSAPAPAGP